MNTRTDINRRDLSGGKNSPASLNRVAVAATIGATIEWYDFFLFGTAAALVFGKLFFPGFDPLVGTIAAFGSFAAGYIARPIGGIVFGHFGDRIGRKSMLVLTLFLMGAGTFLIGILPTYSAIGFWAPLLLFLLRTIQGLAIGGEWGGAVLMTVETAPQTRRGFYGSLVQIGAPAGLLLGTGAFSLVAMLPDKAFLTWGWRVPFLVSIVLIVVGLIIRLRIQETPAFQRIQQTGAKVRMPLLDALRNFPKNSLLAIGARLAEGQTFNIFAVVVVAYGTTQLELPKATVLNAVLLGAAIECLTIPLFGRLSDKLGRKPVFMAGAAFSGIMAFPTFLLLDTKNTAAIWLVVALGLAVGHSAMWATQAAFFSEMFSTSVRYSGVSFVYQLSGLASSGLVPITAVVLIALAGGRGWFVALFVIAYAAISFTSAAFAPETFRASLDKTTVTGQVAG